MVDTAGIEVEEIDGGLGAVVTVKIAAIQEVEAEVIVGNTTDVVIVGVTVGVIPEVVAQ